MNSKNIMRLAAWGLVAFIVFVTICPIGMRPTTETTVNLDRAMAFAVVAFFFVLAYPQRWKEILVLLPIFAFGTEMLQFLSASRHPQLPDASFKAMGAFCGGAGGHVIVMLLTAWRRKSVTSA